MLFYKQTFTFERHFQLSLLLLIVSNFKTRAAVGFTQITHIKSTLALLSITYTQSCHNQSLLSASSNQELLVCGKTLMLASTPSCGKWSSRYLRFCLQCFLLYDNLNCLWFQSFGKNVFLLGMIIREPQHAWRELTEEQLVNLVLVFFSINIDMCCIILEHSHH